MQTDQRITDAYRYLDNLSPEAFAWEFLRRNASYQAAYRSIIERWGCATDPDLPADRAHVIWADPTLSPVSGAAGEQSSL